MKKWKKIEQRQEEILQNQEKQGKHIDRLRDFYKIMYEQQSIFNQLCTNQMNDIEAKSEGL